MFLHLGRILFAGVIFLFFAGCTDQRSENAAHSKPGPAESSASDSSNPFALMSLRERDAIREQLANEGRYDCCVKPGCTACIADRNECTCQMDIRNKDPICGECLVGYREGRGKLKLVSIVELERIRKEKQQAD